MQSLPSFIPTWSFVSQSPQEATHHTSSAVTLSEGSHVMETSVPYQLPYIGKLLALDLKQRPWFKLIPRKCIDKMYYLNAILFWIKQSKQKALQIGSICLLHEVSVKMSRSLSFLLLLLLKKKKLGTLRILT